MRMGVAAFAVVAALALLDLGAYYRSQKYLQAHFGAKELKATSSHIARH